MSNLSSKNQQPTECLLTWIGNMQEFIADEKNWPALEALTANSKSLQEVIKNPVSRAKLSTPPISKMIDHILNDANDTHKFDIHFTHDDRHAVSVPYGSANAASTVANSLRQALGIMIAHYEDQHATNAVNLLSSVVIEVPTKSGSNLERNAHIRISSPKLDKVFCQLKEALADHSIVTALNNDEKLSAKKSTLGRILSDQMLYQYSDAYQVG